MRADPERISHYRLIEKLGQGGMGAVYRAEDVRLGRHVALKLLAGSGALDATARERFLNEARAVATLEHPHICMLYEFDEYEGQQFLAMQLVEGETLHQLVVRGPLDGARASAILRAVAAALGAAHARGIVHRDVKSDNVLLGHDGSIKLADFGIARLTEAAGLTATSSVVGTLSYLSPEQVRGDRAGPPADQFSLAVVAYECLTGALPFEGEGMAAVLFAVVNADPPPPSSRRPGLGTAWDAVVMRGLAKHPEDRFASIVEFAEAFDAATTGVAPAAAPRAVAPAAPTGPRVSAPGKSPAARRQTSVLPLVPEGAVSLPSLAVLYFENQSSNPEEEYFCAGITEDILTDLSKVPGMRVASRNAVARYRGRHVDAKEVASELGVSAVLTGSVRRAGDRVRISVELIDASLGFTAWAERYNRVLDDVFAVQEDIAYAIAAALRGALTPAEAAEIRRSRPAEVEAYDLYLKGRHAYQRYTREDNQQALGHFEQAVDVDPGYALAWAGIADCCLQMNDKAWDTHPAVVSRGHEAARRAIELDPKLPDGHKAEALVWRIKRDHPRAIASLRRALEADPRYLPALINLAQEQMVAGDFAGGERTLRRTVAVDPAYGFGHLLLAFLLFYTRRYDDAVAESHRAQRFGESPFFTSFAYALRSHVYTVRGDLESAVREVAGGRAAGAPEPIMNAAEALVAATMGKANRADALLAALDRDPPAEPYGCELAAAAAARRGDAERAARFLKAAEGIDERHWASWRLSRDLAAVRETPWFAAVIGDRGRALVWPSEAPTISAEEQATFESYGEASGQPDADITAEIEPE